MALTDHLSLRLLNLLLAIRQTGSVSRAAARLHIVPSAASRRIRAAEEAMGVILLERSPRGVVLTPAGQAVVRRAERMRRELSELGTELEDLARGVRGRVGLSAAASAIAQHLPEDLGAFLRRHPDIRVDLQEHFSGVIVGRLRQRLTEVGILVAREPEIPGLRLWPYRQERLVVVLSECHRLAAASSLSFDQILDENWVGLPEGASLARELEEQAAARGKALRALVQVYGMDSVCRMVQNDLGIAVLPLKAVEPANRFPGLAVVPLDESWACRTLYVAIHAEAPLGPAGRALVAALAPAAKEFVLPP